MKTATYGSYAMTIHTARLSYHILYCFAINQDTLIEQPGMVYFYTNVVSW